MCVLNKMYKTSVEQHEIDNMGHMNVQFYVQHALNACELFFFFLDWISKSQSLDSVFNLETILIRYLREQTLATPFQISVNLVHILNSKIVVFLEMHNLKKKEISAAFLLNLIYDVTRSKNTLFLSRIYTDWPSPKFSVPEHGLKKGLSNLPVLDLTCLGINKESNILDSFHGIAVRKNSNEFTQLNAADYMGIVSKAVPHLLLEGGHSIEDTNIGGVALEYEFRFNRFVEVGSGVTLKSGLRQIAEKTYTWTHWLIDISTTEVLAVADSVIITMDLKTRKSVPIPRKMRDKLKQLLI